MIEYLKLIREEWPHVKAAKWVIFLALLLGIAAGYKFSENSNQPVIAQKDATIQYQGEQLADYRAKLQVSSPDEAAKQLADVRHSLDAATRKIQILFPEHPRRSSQNQMDEIKQNKDYLNSILKPRLLIFAGGVGDYVDFALDLTNNLKKS